MLKALVEKISTHILEIGIVSLTPAAAALAVFFRQELTTLVSQATPQSIAILLVLLVLGCLILFALVVHLFPRFKYIQKYQFYQHRINGLYYCPTCRNKKPLSPLRYERTGWRCPFNECSKFYKDPDHKEPEQPQQDLGPHGWMAN